MGETIGTYSVRAMTRCARGAITIAIVVLAGLVPLIANAGPANATPWHVSMVAGRTSLWPSESSLITVYANDVGSTPYFLRIYDNTAGVYVASCGSGSTCQASVTQPTPTTHVYMGVVSSGPPVWDPSTVVGRSAAGSVEWKAMGISLAGNPTTEPVGVSSTVTATTSADIQPTPFYTEIFDVTTKTRVQVCATGTSCVATVSQAAATTHIFVAYFSTLSASYPPSGVQATSNESFVTWAYTSWTLSLSTSPATTTDTSIVTATANRDVLVSPYYIKVFNVDGTILKSCNSGSSCSVEYTTPAQGGWLVAFVASSASGLPSPDGAQASSNVAHIAHS